MARALAIDAQLLVLLVVGLSSPEFIGKHRRLKTYTTGDFDLLRDLMARHAAVVVTPNVLTEASNLLGYSNDPIKSQLFESLRALVGSVREEYVESRLACDRAEFVRLGLSDAALLSTGMDECTLVTSDLDLYLAALAGGRDAINFNHLRDEPSVV